MMERSRACTLWLFDDFNWIMTGPEMYEPACKRQIDLEIQQQLE